MMKPTFPTPTISEDYSPFFFNDSIIENRPIARMPNKGSRTRRPAKQCLHIVRSARIQKSRSNANKNPELSHESIEEAAFMALLTPDRVPEAERDIYKHRMRRAGYTVPPIRLGSKEHKEMLETMVGASADDTFVADFEESCSSRPAKPLSLGQTSISPPFHAPELAPRPADWRIKARKVIEKKGWSLEREMGRSTWKQKVSNEQRLLLLEDDGYDISHLLLKGISADEIITVILERVDARRDERLIAAVSGFYHMEGQTAARAGTEQTAIHHDKTTLEYCKDEDDMAWDDQTLVEDKIMEDSLEPLVVMVTPVIGYKRKHTDEEDEYDDWEGRTQSDNEDPLKSHCTVCSFVNYKTGSAWRCDCGSPRKKPRTKEPKEVTNEEQQIALNMQRVYALQDIFEESRMARVSAIGEGDYAPSFSEVVFKPPVLPQHSNTRTATCISSRGLAFILDEIMYLSSEQRDDGRLIIRETENEGNPIEAICQGPKNPIKFRGPTVALKRLFVRLRDYKLLHVSVPSSAELCWKNKGEVGSFSEETECELSTIIEKLGSGQDNAGVCLIVG
ncbi:hypothetical protein IAQ61_003943 [Plenodomus lingam]|uniref:uncharacterized protein n=1 Tax=Leptosphaeria maculans TaxID=5022 RepID=UPI003331CFAB|nr:hypothetical protein IAQ61_003943 [Plenodomus lingam]